jgi:hypothetical protein
MSQRLNLTAPRRCWQRPAQALPGTQFFTARLLPGGWYTSINMSEKRCALSMSPVPQLWSLIAWCQDDPTERMHLADTLKCSGHRLQRSSAFTDMGRVALSIVEDTCGARMTRWSVPPQRVRGAVVGAQGPWRNSRESTASCRQLGLSRRDIAVP